MDATCARIFCIETVDELADWRNNEPAATQRARAADAVAPAAAPFCCCEQFSADARVMRVNERAKNQMLKDAQRVQMHSSLTRLFAARLQTCRSAFARIARHISSCRCSRQQNATTTSDSRRCRRRHATARVDRMSSSRPRRVRKMWRRCARRLLAEEREEARALCY